MSEYTFDSLRILFNSEEECARALFQARWPDGFRCPRCEHPHAYIISTRRLPLYQCQSCGAQTSLIAGTVMEGSRTPLRLWFQAIFLHSQPYTVNALQLSQTIGVTYKTAWLICHKLRRAMSRADSNELLNGIVHVTDYIYCKRYFPSLDWHQQEQPILIGSSSDEEGEIVRIKIKKQSKEPLRDRHASPVADHFIRENVASEVVSSIVTRRLGKGRNTELLRIGLEAERWLAQVFRGIGPKHLQVYLDHFCYMWNRRKQSMFFNQFLQHCSVTPTITYRTLTASTARRSSRPARPSTLASSLVS